MRPHKPVKTVRRQPADTIILERATPPLPIIPPVTSEAVSPAPSLTLADADDATHWREGIYQRYEASIPRPWRHGGLND
jgi:hypothetical protein